MYCTACGSYSSDAGTHACAKPETPAPSTTTTTVAPGSTPPAGWHPDPDDPALVRYWDGSSWTHHTAWATATGGTSMIGGGRSPQEDGVHGRYLGALPRTVGRRGRFDVLVYENALVFARVPGTDPATLGFVLGFFTVSGLIGYVAGDYIGASGDAARVAELSRLSPAEIAARHKHNAVVPTATITGSEVTTYGNAVGRMKLRTASGRTWKRRWTRPHTKDVNPGFLLGAALGPHVPIQRRASWRPYLVPMVLVALLISMILLAIAVPTFLGARDRARERTAMREVAPSCQAVIDLNDRAARGEQIDPQELVTTVHNLVEPMRTAAGRADAFDPALDAVNRLDAFLGTWDRASELPEPVLTDFGIVLNTCTAAAG